MVRAFLQAALWQSDGFQSSIWVDQFKGRYSTAAWRRRSTGWCTTYSYIITTTRNVFSIFQCFSIDLFDIMASLCYSEQLFNDVQNILHYWLVDIQNVAERALQGCKNNDEATRTTTTSLLASPAPPSPSPVSFRGPSAKGPLGQCGRRAPRPPLPRPGRPFHSRFGSRLFLGRCVDT